MGVANAYEITIDNGPVTDQRRAFTIRSSIGVRNWSKRTPSAVAVRPTHCPGCRLGSCPVGQRLRLVGHGLRSRRVRTALEPDGPVTMVTVFVRRFLCRDCGAAIQVVPAEILPRARYSVTAMARALGMVGFGERSFAEARQAVGDGQNRDWPALRRWHRPLGGLGPRSPFRAVGSARQRAQRVCWPTRLLATHTAAWGAKPRLARAGCGARRGSRDRPLPPAKIKSPQSQRFSLRAINGNVGGIVAIALLAAKPAPGGVSRTSKR